jgi:hypothetical protein
LVAEIQSSVPVAVRRDWPPILGLGNSMVVTLAYLRRNRVQWGWPTYSVSQSTISRAISAVTRLARALARFVPVADELVPGRQYIVDGTLLPCWSWAAQPRLYSGKHKTTGMNVQGRVHPRRRTRLDLRSDRGSPSCFAVLVDHVPAAAQAARTARVSCGVTCSGHGLRNLAAMMTRRSLMAMSS